MRGNAQGVCSKLYKNATDTWASSRALKVASAEGGERGRGSKGIEYTSYNIHFLPGCPHIVPFVVWEATAHHPSFLSLLNTALWLPKPVQCGGTDLLPAAAELVSSTTQQKQPCIDVEEKINMPNYKNKSACIGYAPSHWKHYPNVFLRLLNVTILKWLVWVTVYAKAPGSVIFRVYRRVSRCIHYAQMSIEK